LALLGEALAYVRWAGMDVLGAVAAISVAMTMAYFILGVINYRVVRRL